MLTPDHISTRLRHPRRHGEGWLALCPYHDDHARSLHVGPGFGFNCYGCGKSGSLNELAEFLGMEADRTEYYGRLKPVNNSHLYNYGTSNGGSVDTVYVYTDETGLPLYEVVRYSPKTFRPRMYCYLGKVLLGRVKGLWGRRVLYQLPELLRRKDEKVVIVEGEKDADRLFALGILGTAFALGCSSWRHTDTRCLVGRDVYLLPDNDGVGEGQFQALADHLADKAGRVTTIQLTGLVELGRGADVSDWLDAGHTKEELCELLMP